MSNDERSLRAGINYKTRWYPVPIDNWRQVLESMSLNGIQLIPDPDIRSNIAYNFQYLEYLQQTIIELSLSEVLLRQTHKTYIIVSIGILESMLLHLVLAHGKKEKNFAKIIKLIESSSLLGSDKQIYADLDRFRKLRNKVHLTELRDNLGTDYSAFESSEFTDMRTIIYDIPTSPIFGLNAGLIGKFEFLRQGLAP